MSFWTPENIAEATLRWQRGESAADIGRALGCTRNSVVGKMARLHIQTPKGSASRSLDSRKQHIGRVNTFGAVPQRRPKVSMPSQKERDRLVKLAAAEGKRVGGFTKPKEPSPHDSPNRRHWITRKPCECNYIVEGAGYESLMCCEPAINAGQCATHYALCHIAAVPGSSPVRELLRLVRRAA